MVCGGGDSVSGVVFGVSVGVVCLVDSEMCGSWARALVDAFAGVCGLMWWGVWPDVVGWSL